MAKKQKKGLKDLNKVEVKVNHAIDLGAVLDEFAAPLSAYEQTKALLADAFGFIEANKELTKERKAVQARISELEKERNGVAKEIIRIQNGIEYDTFHSQEFYDAKDALEHSAHWGEFMDQVKDAIKAEREKQTRDLDKQMAETRKQIDGLLERVGVLTEKMTENSDLANSLFDKVSVIQEENGLPVRQNKRKEVVA